MPLPIEARNGRTAPPIDGPCLHTPNIAQTCKAEAEGEGEMTDDDPNEAYEVAPVAPGQHGPPEGWWTVKRNGIPVRYFPGKEKADRYANDPAYRASLTIMKVWRSKK